jgi:hypothetical protein
MQNTTEEKLAQMRALRDAKVMPHLAQYAPVWIVSETPLFNDDTLQFNVVFFHSYYGWVNRRYRFDVFNQVLYHQGQTTISEAQALEITQKKPYLIAETISTVDSYGG